MIRTRVAASLGALALLLAAALLLPRPPMLTDRDPLDETTEGLCPVCCTRARERIRQGRVPRGIGRLRFARDGTGRCGACGERVWPVTRVWAWLRWAAG